MPENEITKETFEAYDQVRKSGITNMLNIKVVCQAANITKEQCLEMIENYDKYSNLYGKQRKETDES